MIAFIIPLRSVKMARSKTMIYKLFERTIRSVTAQTSPHFRVIAVCSETPEIAFQHPNFEHVLVDFPLPERTEDSQNADKAKRILAGLEHAGRYRPTHVMVVDADDCISNRIATFVEKHPDHPGWVLNSGFLYTEGKSIAFKNIRNFNQSCGSSVIIRFDLFRHLMHGQSMYDHNEPDLPPPLKVTPLPFAGAVYSIQNGENFFMTTGKIGCHKRTEGRLRYYIRKVMKYRPVLVTPRFRNQFNLYRISA